MSTFDKDKEYTITLSPEDIVDVRLLIRKGSLAGFVMSYRAKIKEEWYEVYRVDTCHDYLHLQKFWESPEPQELKEYKDMPLEMVLEEFLEKLRQNHTRYRQYVEQKVER